MVAVRNKILILILCAVFFLVGCGGPNDIDLSKGSDDDFVTASIHLVWENTQDNLFRARSRALTVDPNSLKYIIISVYDENDDPLVEKQQFEYKDHQGTVRVKAGPDRTFVAEGKLPSGYIVFRGENSLDLERGTRPKVDIPMSQDNEPPQDPNISGPSNTISRSVTFSISSTDKCGITGYLISEISESDPRLKDPNWPHLSDPNWKEIDPNWQTEKKDEKIYRDDINFTLSEGDGTKTVYLCFRDGIGNRSVRVSHRIEYKSSNMPGITVSPATGLITTETGGTASLSVVLDTQPEADVKIRILSNDETEGKVDPNSLDPNSCLIFTHDNWDIVQDVRIIGKNDSVADGDIEYQINIEAAISADPKYNGLLPVPNFISLINWDIEGSYFEPDANTIALWHLNIDGIDASGNGNDLEVKEDRVNWVNGMYGRAAEMGIDPWSSDDCSNSDGGALTAPGVGCSYPGNSDWTVEAWVQFPLISKGYAIVYHYSEHLAGHEPYLLGISNGMAMFQIQDSSGNSETVSVDISSYANQWIHIACVYHYRHNLELYINMYLEEQVDTELIPEVLTNYNVYLGGSYCGTSTGLRIDEVRISNIARYGDTDSDGMPDFWEIRNNLDPNYPNDADEDPDIDKLINLEEYNHKTDPFDNDTDGDGCNDGDEVLAGNNPNDPNDFPAPKRLYVDIDASGNEDGRSWGNAYKNLQDALSVAVRGNEVWVAEGIYKPDQGIGIVPGDRNASFHLKNSVSVYGGFAGNETSLDQRDWLLHQTILSGDLNRDDDPNFSNNDENSYHVVVSDSVEMAVMDGFVITSGNANGFDPTDKGGGMYNYYGNPTITNCTFSENYANRGGGIYNDYSSPTINDCTFRENFANDAGGGIYNYNKSPIIANSTFLKNIARVGAGICNQSSNIDISNSTFNENFASDSGGGMYNTFSYSPSGNIWISQCTFKNNSAETYGGGINNSSGCNAIVDNCSFQNNKAWIGGGMMNSSESNIKVENSNFFGNSASLRGGGMYNTNNTPILINCQFIQNSSDEEGGGIYHTITNSAITNCIFSKNTADYAGGVYIEGFDSMNKIINCTFHGNSVSVGAGGLLNKSSNISLINCILWGNTAVSYGPQIGIIGGTMSINYCDIQGGKDEIYQSDIIAWGIGNIDVDPLFIDPNEDDYHLQPGSPCIDAGDPDSASPNFPDKDIDNESRPYGGHYDMGADESTLMPPQYKTIFPGDGRVTILWDAVPGATNYNIYIGDTNGVSKTDYIAKETVNTTYYTWTGLTNGTAYYFVLTSENSLDEEGYESEEIIATTNAQQNYYIFPDRGIDTAPTDVTIIGKDFQETTTISLYGGGPYIKGSCDTPGDARGVYVADKYAYVAVEDSGLQVVEISDPDNPFIIDSCDTPGSAIDVYVAGKYAYVAVCSSGLQVIEISDPTDPSIIGSCDTPISPYGVGIHVTDNYAYLAGHKTGLQVIEISDPSNPSIIGSCDTPGYPRDIYVAGKYAYVADYSSGLQVIEISDPNNPFIIGSCDTPGYAYDVYVAGNYAYVADEDSGLQVIDISNPNILSIIGSCDTPKAAYDVYVADNYAYVAEGNRGLEVIDISDPSNPFIIGLCDTPHFAYDVYVAGNYAYVADSGSGLQVIDISDHDNPSIIGLCDTPHFADDVYVADNYAYVAEHANLSIDWSTSGLQVIDISDPNTPSIISSCNTPGKAESVYVVDNHAYVADNYKGFQVIDISDPKNPFIIGSCDTPGKAESVCIVDNYAYVADATSVESWLQVIDITEPNNPFIIGFCGTRGYPEDVYVAGNYAYVADNCSGLQVIDISDPKNPFIIGSCDSPYFANGVYVAGAYAFVTDYYKGFQVIDISDPKNPFIIGSCNTPSYSNGVYVADNYAYVADGSSGLQVIDISDPNNPFIIASCDTPVSSRGVYVTDKHVYVADEFSGLLVIEKYKPIKDKKNLDPYLIKATIPNDYRPGTYNLHITNPDGEHTLLRNAFTVYNL